MNYQGYPQQPQGQRPGPGYQYPPPPQPVSSGDPTLAIITAVLGLAVAGVLGYQTIDLLANYIPDGVELPGGWTVMIILHFLVVGVGLIGAILVFARQVAGVVLLIATAVLTLGVMLLDGAIAEFVWGTMLDAPPTGSHTSHFAEYFEALFDFGNGQAVLRAICLFASPVLLLLACLPAVRKNTRRAGYQQGW